MPSILPIIKTTPRLARACLHPACRRTTLRYAPDIERRESRHARVSVKRHAVHIIRRCPRRHCCSPRRCQNITGGGATLHVACNREPTNTRQQSCMPLSQLAGRFDVAMPSRKQPHTGGCALTPAPRQQCHYKVRAMLAHSTHTKCH